MGQPMADAIDQATGEIIQEETANVPTANA
jgi:hypothetical protein